MKGFIVSTKPSDELKRIYAKLVNITRNKDQEIEFQVIKYELEKRAAL